LWFLRVDREVGGERLAPPLRHLQTNTHQQYTQAPSNKYTSTIHSGTFSQIYHKHIHKHHENSIVWICLAYEFGS
jgi:hypothetical protein